MEPHFITLPRLLVVGVPYFGTSAQGEFAQVWTRLEPLLPLIPNQKPAGPGLPPVFYGVESYGADMAASGRWFYLAGVEVANLDDVPVQVVAKIVPARQYAVFPYQGLLPGQVGELFQYAYKEWLPKSGYEQAGPFDLERYDHRFKGGQNPESVTEICIPVDKLPFK